MKFFVLSPEISCIEPVLDDGSGPKVFYRCYAEVEARDPIEAKVKAVRTDNFKAWRDWQKDNDSSPYEGLKARRLSGGTI